MNLKVQVLVSIRPHLIVFALLAAPVAGCASTEAARQANDPFEPANRAVFAFNEALDDAAIGPVARVYADVTPRPAQTGVRNVMMNLNQPVVFANAVLQGDVHAAGDTLGRLFLNTVFGLGGVIDVASAEDVPLHTKDFGQTLAIWGAPAGPYLVLPVFGPSNVRDGAGRLIDRYPHPLNWNAEESMEGWAWSVRGLNGIDFRARADDALQSLDRAAIDPYVQVRSAWRQARDAQIRGETPAEESFEDLPEFE